MNTYNQAIDQGFTPFEARQIANSDPLDKYVPFITIEDNETWYHPCIDHEEVGPLYRDHTIAVRCSIALDDTIDTFTRLNLLDLVPFS